VRTEGIIWTWLHGRGARDQTKIGRDSCRDLRGCVVFVPVSLDGMTGGTPCQRRKKEGFGTDLEEKENGPWASSSLGPKCCPAAF
jgi:hypothetical protein